MNLNEIYNNRILFGAFNWGLGHVTRSIGVINKLITQNNEIIIVCDKSQEIIFKQYFPYIKTIYFSPYPLHFRGKNTWAIDIILMAIKLLKHIKKERKFISSIVSKEKIDIVLSDHRYGFLCKNVNSIFITHQLQLPIPWYFIPAQFIHKSLIKKFNHVWILDDINSSLAGKLSNNKKWKNTSYIGYYSRFDSNKYLEKEFDYLFVISGPEIYTNDFIEIINKFHNKEKKSIVLSHFEIDKSFIDSTIKIHTTKNLKESDNLFYLSEIIISRCGYSTIMDIKALNKNAILIPSKGQYEQEYLSKLHNSLTLRRY